MLKGGLNRVFSGRPGPGRAAASAVQVTGESEAPPRRSIVVFLIFGVVITLIRTLFIPSESGALHVTQPLSAARMVGLTGALLLASLWVIRPIPSIPSAIPSGRHSAWRLALYLPLALYLVSILVWVDRPGVAVLVLPIVTRNWLPLRWNVLFTVLVAVGYTAYYVKLDSLAPTPFLASGQEVLTFVVLIFAQMVFSYTAFELAVLSEQRQVKLRRAMTELQGYQKAELERAILQERAHLSRELHDTLGHSLVVVRLSATQLRKLPGPAFTPPQQEALDLLIKQNDEAFRQLQQIVLASCPPQLDGTLAEGISHLATNWPNPVRLRVLGPEPELPDAAKIAFYRGFQEGLTNAHKHAPGQAVNAELKFGERTVLTVRNALPTEIVPVPSARTGLAGLRERFRAQSGDACATIHQGVFELCLWLPRAPHPSRT